MSDRISVITMLEKGIMRSAGYSQAELDRWKKFNPKKYEGMKLAVKEIVEAVIDRCSESARLAVFPYDQEEWENVSAKVTVEDLSHAMEDGEVEVSKGSILKVKEEVQYD